MAVAEDLPQECWELILSSLDHHRHLEPISLLSTRFLSISNHLRRTLTISSPTLPFLPRLFRRFPNVKEITVRDFHGQDLNPVLLQIARSGLDLESIDLSNHNNCRLPLVGLREIGWRMRNLRRLNCSNACFLDNRDLMAIGSLFPSLEELDISSPCYPNVSLDLRGGYAGVVTDDGVLDLTMKLRNLRRIDLSGNHFITDKAIVGLALNCGLLGEVAIRDCEFIAQNGIGLLIRNNVNLNCISLDGVGVPCIDSFFQESFAYARNLGELHLSNSFLSDEFLCCVGEACIPLRKLSISNCYNFTVLGLSYLLNRCQFLEHLDLEGANFLTDESMIELSQYLSNITFINLSSCSKLTSMTFLMLIRNCPMLRDIKMERTNLGLEEFEINYVINQRVLSLSLSGNNNLSDECVGKIAVSCPNLQVLEINFCPTITERGIREVMQHCCQIKHLQISRCMGVLNLDIDFEIPKMEALQARGLDIDDKTLVVIAKRCRGLLHLDLESCLNITDKGVSEVVQNCRKLREINLKWCDRVTVDIVAYLVLSRPSLRKIIPPGGLVPTDKQTSFFLRHGCMICKG